MTDIFDAKIMCKNCNKEMKSTIVNRNGFELRAVECSNCHDKIIHPADLNGLEHFKDLKGKTFNVKLRMVGNSHAISIPKEIIEFVNERHKDMRKQMDDMVRLCFEDFDTLRVRFWDENGDDGVAHVDDGNEGERVRRRVMDYGGGNVDIIERENLNDEEKGISGFRMKKIIRRREK